MIDNSTEKDVKSKMVDQIELYTVSKVTLGYCT
jgi:hypothetical protein